MTHVVDDTPTTNARVEVVCRIVSRNFISRADKLRMRMVSPLFDRPKDKGLYGRQYERVVFINMDLIDRSSVLELSRMRNVKGRK